MPWKLARSCSNALAGSCWITTKCYGRISAGSGLALHAAGLTAPLEGRAMASANVQPPLDGAAMLHLDIRACQGAMTRSERVPCMFNG